MANGPGGYRRNAGHLCSICMGEMVPEKVQFTTRNLLPEEKNLGSLFSDDRRF